MEPADTVVAPAIPWPFGSQVIEQPDSFTASSEQNVAGIARLDVWFREGDAGWQRFQLLRGIFSELCRRYPHVCFRAVDAQSLGLPQEVLDWPGSPASGHMLRVVNPESGAYSVVSYWDNNCDPLRRHMGWEPSLMRQLIATSGISAGGYAKHRAVGELAETRPLHAFHVPFTYDTFRVDALALIDRQRSKTPRAAHRRPGLLFRGLLHDVRTELLEHLPSELVVAIDVWPDGKLDTAEYLAELSLHKLALSINGAGEICNRDMEILGLGLPLFRPELRCQFHEPLIPDVHYVRACHAPDVPLNGTFRFSDPQRAAEEIVANCKRWEHEPEALDRIAANGRAWFERNVLPERQVALACDLLDLSLLGVSAAQVAYLNFPAQPD